MEPHPAIAGWYLFMTRLRQSAFAFGFAGFIRLRKFCGGIRRSPDVILGRRRMHNKGFPPLEKVQLARVKSLAGFTLAEVLISILLLAIIMTSGMSFYFNSDEY